MTSTWQMYGGPVCGVVSVLFTRDKRVFFRYVDGTTRVTAEWERDEVLLQLLSRRDQRHDGHPAGGRRLS